MQLIVNATRRMTSYDLTSGKIIWECGGQTPIVIPSPVLAGDRVICMSGFRGSALYAIPLDVTGDITGTNKIAWQRSGGTPYVPSPLLYGELLYFTRVNRPTLTCVNAATGKPYFEGERIPGLSSLYASAAGAADRMYYVGRNGTTVVLKRGAAVEVLATNELDDPIDASPAIVGKQLFLRGKRHLYCIAAE
jgi:outer membrane protein assembly factor BamB